MFNTDLQKTVFLNTYSRWNLDLNRRETWEETVERVMLFFKREVEKRDLLSVAPDWDVLSQAMHRLEVLPSMRIVQMAGPALERCNVGAYNCAYLPLQDWQCFSELLYILMQGTGCGFSVEQKYVDMFDPIRQIKDYPATKLIIEDTTEGWCNALLTGLNHWSSGYDVEFDYSQIRPYGSPLLTKGGKSSGPQPLKDLLDFSRKLLLAHQGRRLSSLNLHDLACYCGSIVQVGGVRRSAEISLSDLHDHKLRHAKQGRFYELYPERMMANNSVVYNQKPPIGEFITEWVELMNSGTGERGIFNRGGINALLPCNRLERDDWGLNPCGEIILRPFEFCNLSIAVARAGDTLPDLIRKVKLATQFGVMQSLLTDFKYIRTAWTDNCNEERLLGVDITGQMDCAILNGKNADRDVVYRVLKGEVISEAGKLSSAFNLPMSAALTCVKPSGNSSQLLNVSSGLHPRYAPYYIRRLRIGASSAISKLLIKNGVPHHPETGQNPDSPTVWVFEFIVKSPQDAVVRSDRTALEQLEQWLSCKQNWTEHNPSQTVYVKEDEWLEVGAWVYKNWDSIGGLSFLPWDGGTYQLAPYESITEDEYNKRASEWPNIDFGQLPALERGDGTEFNREFACTGDKCEL